MRIGLLFGLDDKTVLDYIGESDRDIIRYNKVIFDGIEKEVIS